MSQAFAGTSNPPWFGPIFAGLKIYRLETFVSDGESYNRNLHNRLKNQDALNL